VGAAGDAEPQAAVANAPARINMTNGERRELRFISITLLNSAVLVCSILTIDVRQRVSV